MKRGILIGLLLALVLGMASYEYRENRNPIGKLCIAEQSWDNGESAAATDTLTFSGKVTQIEFDCAENTTEGITFTVAVTTSDGGSLFSQGALADNGATILRAYSNKGTQDADFDAFLVAEQVTVTVTPSGDPGTSGATVNVGFYVE